MVVKLFTFRNFIRVRIHQFTLRHYAFGRRLGQLLIFQHSFQFMESLHMEACTSIDHASICLVAQGWFAKPHTAWHFNFSEVLLNVVSFVLILDTFWSLFGPYANLAC